MSDTPRRKVTLVYDPSYVPKESFLCDDKFEFLLTKIKRSSSMDLTIHFGIWDMHLPVRLAKKQGKIDADIFVKVAKNSQVVEIKDDGRFHPGFPDGLPNKIDYYLTEIL